jgi:hypothetical protein
MSDADARPNRWIHLRLPRAFTADEFHQFTAHAQIWRRYVEATLELWSELGHGHSAPAYEFFLPELSDDGSTASVPVGGDWTLASRALFEIGATHLLWQHFPIQLQNEAEEGLTEEHDGIKETHWRPARRIELPRAEAQPLDWPEAHHHPNVLDTARRALWWISGILPRG